MLYRLRRNRGLLNIRGYIGVDKAPYPTMRQFHRQVALVHQWYVRLSRRLETRSPRRRKRRALRLNEIDVELVLADSGEEMFAFAL